MSSFSDDLIEQLVALPPYLAGHVQLTLVALSVGLLISLPLGIAASRRPRLEAWALGVASVAQTIPGLALLALMVPLLGGVGAVLAGLGWPAPPSIGFLPAVLALSLYSVLPMLRNSVTGLAGVDPALCEAARGVGMSPREMLWQVELPLAMPTIVAGVRTATVWVVGTATLATPVGGASLGNPIFAGLQTRNLSAVLVASVAAAALALCLDSLVRAIEVGLERGRRGPVLFASIVLVLLALWSGFGALSPSRSPESAGAAGGARKVVVAIGSKAFTEQYVLAEILAGRLEQEPGVTIRRVPSLGSTVAFDALVTGDLDLYVDYSGTLWTTILGRDGMGASRVEVLRGVTDALSREHGIDVVAALGFENTYALAMREAAAERLGIRRISDLRGHAAGFEILGDFEFFGRPEWTQIVARYGLAFGRERAMDSSLMYEALAGGSADVIAAYSTDGRIAAYSLRVLEDDRGVIPPYDALVLMRHDFAAREPGLMRAVASLAGRLDAAAMRRLNAAVDLEGRAPESVAAQWLAACAETGTRSGIGTGSGAGAGSGDPCRPPR